MNEQIDLSQLWNVFKRSFVAMIVLGILGAAAAFFGTKALVAPKYQSSTSMLVNRKQDNNPNMQLNAQQADIQLINTYKDIITRPLVLQAVSDNLTSPQKVVTKKAQKAVYGTRYNALTGVQERYVTKEAQPATYKLRPAKYTNLTEGDIASKVSVSSSQNSQVFTISVRDTNPTRARDIANEIAEVFKEKIATIMSISNVSIVSQALANPDPVAPNLKLYSLIGLFVGVMVAFLWGLVRELTDRTIKDIDFITDDLGLVNLGIVNYVQKMKDIDQAIESKKTDSVDNFVSGGEESYPQRSRRRI